ncbi:MAG TPA: hypothetical protein VKU41_09475 [Polyangiaceae bacterium]|nr:hypothetical protein [Polyangiaceae bacterium]
MLAPPPSPDFGDPRALYVVSAIVGAGLAIWVALVLWRSPRA